MIKLSEVLHNTDWNNVTNVIYKITNQENGKIYIGQTSISLRKRLLKHISDAKEHTKSRKHYFQYAILKYGLQSFVVEIVEVCEKHLLDEKEIYWIKHYKSTDSALGYNCTHGGQGNKTSTVVSLKTRKLISEAHKQKWKDPEYRKQQQQSRKLSYERKKIKIVQLDLSYNLIKTWNSKSEVCEEFNSQIFKLSENRPIMRIGINLFTTLPYYSTLELKDPVILQLDADYKIINKYYSYTDANVMIKHLTGKHGHLKKDANQKHTKQKGTRKAGYIWMTYSNYKL